MNEMEAWFNLKWLLMVSSLLGVLYVIWWTFWDDDWGVSDFFESLAYGFIVPFALSPAELMIKLTILVVALFAGGIYLELAPETQAEIQAWYVQNQPPAQHTELEFLKNEMQRASLIAPAQSLYP